MRLAGVSRQSGQIIAILWFADHGCGGGGWSAAGGGRAPSIIILRMEMVFGFGRDWRAELGCLQLK